MSSIAGIILYHRYLSSKLIYSLQDPAYFNAYALVATKICALKKTGFLFCVSIMVSLLKGPQGKSQMSPMPSSLIQPCWDPQDTFSLC